MESKGVGCLSRRMKCRKERYETFCVHKNEYYESFLKPTGMKWYVYVFNSFFFWLCV